jgi:cellulose synthase/poly-beta-1,6-N-acetylglucosamine synthase-like glycosyltransferase
MTQSLPERRWEAVRPELGNATHGCQALVQSNSGKTQISVLMPATRARYLDEALRSVRRQSAPPHEFIILVHSGDRAEDAAIRALVAEFADAFPLDRRPFAIREFCSTTMLATSEACRFLLDHAEGDYVTTLADDDVLDTDFIRETLRSIELNGSPVITTGTLFDLSHPSAPVLDTSRVASTSRLVNRLLSVVSGLIPGGGTAYPARLARACGVFDSPQPIVTEDQLLSTRLFRHWVKWEHVPGARYGYRSHPDQTGSGSPREWYGVGVCRQVRLSEESHALLRLLAVVGLGRELSRASDQSRFYYRGYLDAGGSRSLARFGLLMPAAPLALGRPLRRGVVRGAAVLRNLRRQR